MTEIERHDLRCALAPYAYDGSEAVAAISALVDGFAEHSHPQALAAAIRKILVRQYAGCVPLDAVIDHCDLGRLIVKGLRLHFSERLRCVCKPKFLVAYDIELGRCWLRAICRRCGQAILLIELSND
jgi:hypothetical protein